MAVKAAHAPPVNSDPQALYARHLASSASALLVPDPFFKRRFALFNKAAVEVAHALPVSPGEKCVFVANDWYSALVPVLIKVRTVWSGWVWRKCRPRVGAVGV